MRIRFDAIGLMDIQKKWVARTVSKAPSARLARRRRGAPAARGSVRRARGTPGARPSRPASRRCPFLQCAFPKRKAVFVENSTSQLKMNHLIHFSSFRINHTNHKTSLKTREQEADALLGMGESLVL